MRRHIYTQADYNLWATNKIVSFLQTISLTQLEQALANSFPNIAATALHIHAAEVTWVLRMQSNPPAIWPAESFKGTTSDILQAWKNSSKDLKTYVENQSEVGLLSLISYTTFDGIKLTNTKEQILFHVFNHSTYHRGQIITMLKQLGILKVPSTDLFDFYNLKEN